MLRRTALVIVAIVVGSGMLAVAQNPTFALADVQIGYFGTVVPPDVTCAGGEPSGLPFPPCSAETTHALARGEIQTWGPVPFSDVEPVPELLNGPITFVVNCNMNADYRGPCWGTFEWDIPGIGTWEGSWTAPVMDLLTYESRLSMVGHGVGGEIDGKQLKFDGGSAPYEWYITGTVRIH